MKIWNLQLVNLCIAFKTCILYHHTAKHMLPKERLHYFIFRFDVKITKNENFFRENICFSWLEPWELIQLTIFHLFKGYNFYIRWNFKILKPSWRYVWFNKYHQATYPVHMDGLYWYTNWLLGKDSSNFVSAMQKISIYKPALSTQ